MSSANAFNGISMTFMLTALGAVVHRRVCVAAGVGFSMGSQQFQPQLQIDALLNRRVKF